MATTPFPKVPLTYDAQLQLLVDRGLIIENKVKALFLLENISYFRLSGYWFPLLADKPNHVFKTASSTYAMFVHIMQDFGIVSLAFLRNPLIIPVNLGLPKQLFPIDVLTTCFAW